MNLSQLTSKMNKLLQNWNGLQISELDVAKKSKTACTFLDGDGTNDGTDDGTDDRTDDGTDGPTDNK